MAFSSIEEVFEAFNNLKVLVIGDSMIDTYTHGTVERVSPEAPVPIVNVFREESRLGGSANVAVNLAGLGAEPILCTVCGDDNAGDQFISLLQEHHLSTSGVMRVSNRPTTIKNRIMSGSNYLLRVDTETDEYLPPSHFSEFISKVLALLPTADLVIFEDYDKGALGAELIQSVISACRQSHIPVAVDPKFRNFDTYKGATLFKPNWVEFESGTAACGDQAILEKVNYLKGHLQFENLILTRSSKGVFYSSSKESGEIPAHVRAVSDVSGAGDTVIAIAGLALALQLPIRFIAELANLGGGIVCEYSGVVPIPKERLLREAIATLTLIK